MLNPDDHYDTKTQAMKGWHPAEYLNHNDKKYRVVDSSINFATTDEYRFASLGAGRSALREMAIFNTLGCETHTPLDSFLNNEDKVKQLMAHMSHIPKAKNFSSAALSCFIKNYPHSNPGQPPIIPLSVFYKNGLMVCRHRALYLAAIMGNHIKAGNLNHGNVHIYRDSLHEKTKGSAVTGGHGWVVYSDHIDNKIYLLDPMWGKIFDFSNPKDLKQAKETYGRVVIEHMQARIHEYEHPSSEWCLMPRRFDGNGHPITSTPDDQPAAPGYIEWAGQKLGFW